MHTRINTTYSPINCPAKPFGGVVLVTDRFGKWREVAFQIQIDESLKAKLTA